jgi:aryl-alcohol dehydrogenase-like predicted oxidoreductase
MTKAWGVLGEEQFAAYPIMDQLRQSKDYVNQFGIFSLHLFSHAALSPASHKSCYPPQWSQPWELPYLHLPNFSSHYSKSHNIGLSRTSLFSAVDSALERLSSSYIDLFWIHRFDHHTPIDETIRALHDLVLSGKIRYIGASSMWTYQFAMMQFCAEKNGWTKFVAMQGHYSLLYREEEREMNKFCKETGVAICPWGPLAQGQLARPLTVRGHTTRSAGGRGDPSNTRPEAVAIVKRVEELAAKKGWTMSQVTLAWTLKRVTSPITGFSCVERIEDALSVRGKALSADEERLLEELYTPLEVEGHS